MMWLLTRPVVWPVKTAGYGLSAGYRTGRLVGYRRLSVFGLGVVVGMLLAPGPGAELRAVLKERLFPAEPIALPPAPGDRHDEPIDLTAPGI